MYVSTSNHVQVQGFLSNEVLYVALNNLDDNPQEIDLNHNLSYENVEDINIKSLTVFRDDFQDIMRKL